MTLTGNMAGTWKEAAALSEPRLKGKICSVTPVGFEVAGLSAALGDLLIVETEQGPLQAKVTALKPTSVVASAFDVLTGIKVGDTAYTPGGPPLIPTGTFLLGRVVNGLGKPIDSLGSVAHLPSVPATAKAPHPLTRELVSKPFVTGVRAIDSALPMAKGQRVGIFAGSGVGKSTLLSMIVAGSTADVIVIGMVGERGREVRDFIDNQLGKEGLAKSVVVVATGDEPALMRYQSAATATRIAEDFRDQGNDVLLVVDSITRFAQAQREIGLATGEIPAARGYTPSVLSELPKLLERAGNSDTGSITALYTVLVDGDDINDPISDAARGILDGHIVLSRDLANAGHFPAIDILNSVSRLANVLHTDTQSELAFRLRSLLATYDEAKDLIEVGAYTPGTSKETDAAIAAKPLITEFLTQSVSGQVTIEDTWNQLAHICKESQ